MRWIVAALLAAVVVGVGWYVWGWNKRVDDVAASNNGVVCAVDVQLDSELWNEYTTYGIRGALGALPGETSDELMADIRSLLTSLEQLSESQCVMKVSKIPAMQSGRFKANLYYYRPYPIGQVP